MKRFILCWSVIILASGFKPTVAQNSDSNHTVAIHPGDKAPNFSLLGTDGKMHTLPELKGIHGCLVIFTCNHCPFSQAYETRIIQLHKRYAPKGIPVIAINPNDSLREPDDSYSNMVARSHVKKYPFHYLADFSQAIALAYGATRTPHLFLLDAQGVIQYIGSIDDNFEEPENVKEKYVEQAIEELLAGRTITRPITKAIGCGIKWKKHE